MNGFGQGFRWGVATSSFQIEGAPHEDGREDSIWDVFCRQPGAIANGDDGSAGIDHYHRWTEDLDLMAELGIRNYRFSTSWSRVVHADGSRNAPGLDFYSRLVDGLLERNIEPWLTIYHWDLPASLPGGWTNRDTVSRFTDYAMLLHERLGDRVRTWTTLNEPWCSAFLGYASGEHAPGHTDYREAIRAVHHLLLAHGWATRALREADAGAKLGITLNLSPTSPAEPTDPRDVDCARRIDGTANRIFLDPLFRGQYPLDVREDLAQYWPDDLVREGDQEAIAAPIDVLGVNYYTTEVVAHGHVGAKAAHDTAVDTENRPSPHPSAPSAQFPPRPQLAKTAMGWSVDPQGLRHVLGRLHREYTAAAGTEIVITENGAAYQDACTGGGRVIDDDRIAYINAHLDACRQAIGDGVPLRGYLLWTLADNFEWAYGYEKKFGIVSIGAKMARVPKASGQWYASVISSNGAVVRQEA